MGRFKREDAVLFNDIKEILYNCSKKFGKNTAYVIKRSDGTVINKSFEDLLFDVNMFGSGLFELGLRGKRVAVLGRNRYEWAVSHLANLLGGIVSVPLDKELSQIELEDSLRRSGVSALVYDEKYCGKIDALKESFDNVRFICMAEGSGELAYEDVISAGSASTEKIKEYESFKVDPDALSVLLFTSGTTDKSKAVMLCQRGIAQNVYDMQLVEDIRSDDVNIAFLPFHHIFGSTGMVMMLACGTKTVFTDGLRYIKRNLREYGVSVFVGVPVIIDSLYAGVQKEIKKQKAEKKTAVALRLTSALQKLGIDVRRRVFKSVIDGLGGSMRLIISGGAPLDIQTAKGFNDMGIELVQGYGLTETSPVIAAESRGNMRLGSVGKPMKSVEVRIADKDAAGIGEIQVRGKNVMLGYYNNDEATRAVMRGGWFCTGDLGMIDSDGFLYVTGRQKDMIVMKNGKKVFPEELETLINRIDGVRESFVYGVGEQGLGCSKILCKVVYDKNAFSESEDEMHSVLWQKIKDINKTLPMYKYIKGMSITDEPLIKTTTNKIKRKEELLKTLNENNGVKPK